MQGRIWQEDDGGAYAGHLLGFEWVSEGICWAWESKRAAEAHHRSQMRGSDRAIGIEYYINCRRSWFKHGVLNTCAISVLLVAPNDALILWRPVLPVGRIAEDRTNCELIAKEEAAIQQLVLMALSENQVVVKQACKTIGEAGSLKCGGCPSVG